MMRLAIQLFLMLTVVVSIGGCNWLLGSDSNTGTASEKPAVILESVGGQIRYQDRVYNDSGFITGNTPYKAVRSVVVDLIDADTSEIVATTQTNAAGNYQFENINAGRYQLHVVARTITENDETISVFSTDGTLYAIAVDVEFDEESVTANADMTISSRTAAIFNMLDVMLSGYEFFDAMAPDYLLLNDLNLYWRYGSSEGSYTCFETGAGCDHGPGIYVLSDPYQSADTDEFDDDVLWHEFAHHIERSLNLTDSPGGYHTLSNMALDLRLSWSEGFASYVTTAVKNWLSSNNPGHLSTPGYLSNGYYIDNRESYPRVSIDFENLSSGYKYATNEAAIAHAVGKVAYYSGHDAVWDAVLSNMLTNSTADTLEAFWDSLNYSQPSPVELAQWESVISARSIEYISDAFEADDQLADATNYDCTITTQTLPYVCVDGEQHSLYVSPQVSDDDYLAITVTSGQSYQIHTHDLRNGADTVISLWDSTGQPLLDGSSLAIANDDATDCELTASGCNPLHDGTNFSSLVTFSADNDETLFVRIEPSTAPIDQPDIYGYLARYGSYAITVQAVD